jgi:O-antigen/teichoic acid export membrane protein
MDMDSYRPRSSVTAIITGLILSWLVGPGIGAFGFLIAGTPNPEALRVALPIYFLAGGVAFIGFICILVGILRALRTVDFLGRREAARMEDEDYRAGYTDR